MVLINLSSCVRYYSANHLPNACTTYYTGDKVQTTPAENCCMGGSPASVMLHDLRQNYMTTYILY